MVFVGGIIFIYFTQNSIANPPANPPANPTIFPIKTI